MSGAGFCITPGHEDRPARLYPHGAYCGGCIKPPPPVPPPPAAVVLPTCADCGTPMVPLGPGQRYHPLCQPADDLDPLFRRYERLALRASRAA
jgi:hypothetical protein